MKKKNLVFGFIFFLSRNLFAQKTKDTKGNLIITPIEKETLLNDFSVLEDDNYSIISFSMVSFTNGFEEVEKSNSSKLTPIMVSFIENTPMGEIIMIEDIIAVKNNGDTIKVDNKVIKLK